MERKRKQRPLVKDLPAQAEIAEFPVPPLKELPPCKFGCAGCYCWQEDHNPNNAPRTGARGRDDSTPRRSRRNPTVPKSSANRPS